MKPQIVSLTFAIVASLLAWARPALADFQSEEFVQRAGTAVQGEHYTEALDLMRQAYRADPSPRWLYDLAVVHDHLGECDDAAFFYRAAIWGKGVLPQPGPGRGASGGAGGPVSFQEAPRHRGRPPCPGSPLPGGEAVLPGGGHPERHRHPRGKGANRGVRSLNLRDPPLRPASDAAACL